jgi:hypothetical protein
MVEQDHRYAKRRTKLGISVFFFETAEKTLCNRPYESGVSRDGNLMNDVIVMQWISKRAFPGGKTIAS